MKFASETVKKARSFILFLGVLVSWSTTIAAFRTFYQLEGTIFKIKDCILPNPITTPCFWGALAFFGAFIWSLRLLKISNTKSEKYLFYFLIFCVLFAWSNFVVELKGVKAKPGSLVAPCPTTTKSPFTSACFFGSILFTLSTGTGYLLVSKPKEIKENEDA